MTTYRVNNIYPTIQGEGCQTGVPMVLVRLHGCAVGCPWCDTKETWHVQDVCRRDTIAEALGQNPLWAEATGEQISDFCDRFVGPKWALVTGGEPADYDLADLVEWLHARGYRAALETSGTALGHRNAGFDWVCVSPKIGMPGGKPVLNEAFAWCDEIKHVVGTPADVDQLDQLLSTISKGHMADIQVCLQPVSASKKATDLCMETAMKRGWRLSIQTHKLLAIP